MFRILADAQAREVMTAAALLVVLGAALVMQLGGLSMAMGAFLAGVLLSESTFRHQLEADIEPFRGILLGLFFLGVGMSLDLAVIARHWPLILAGVPAYMLVKAAGIYVVARLFKASHREGIYRAALLAQGGEFAFVLYAAAAGVGLFDATTNAILTATVIISMALTPLGVFALRWLLPDDEQSMDGVEAAEDLHGSVLVIGFGRFGQVASQIAAGARHRRLDHRHRHRDDPQRRRLRLQGLLRRRLPARRAARRRRRRGQGDPGLRRQARRRRPHRRAGQGGVSAGQASGALLRPRACAAAGRGRRRRADPRDLRSRR